MEQNLRKLKKRLKLASSRIIAIEGLDGVGKETIAHAVVNELTTRGYNVDSVSFPRYDTNMGHAIEDYLHGAYGKTSDVIPFLSYSPYILDMINYFKENPFEDSDLDFLVLDRGIHSNLFYQGSLCKDYKDFNLFLRMWSIAMNEIPSIKQFFFEAYFLKLNEHDRRVQVLDRNKLDQNEKNLQYQERIKNFAEFIMNPNFVRYLPPEFKQEYCNVSLLAQAISSIEVKHVSGSEAIYEESKRVARLIADNAEWDLDDNDFLEGVC